MQVSDDRIFRIEVLVLFYFSCQKIPLSPPEAVKKIHSWFENLTTNGFQVPSFRQLAVPPELHRRATAIFSQLPFGKGGSRSTRAKFNLANIFRERAPYTYSLQQETL